MKLIPILAILALLSPLTLRANVIYSDNFNTDPTLADPTGTQLDGSKPNLVDVPSTTTYANNYDPYNAPSFVDPAYGTGGLFPGFGRIGGQAVLTGGLYASSGTTAQLPVAMDGIHTYTLSLDMTPINGSAIMAFDNTLNGDGGINIYGGEVLAYQYAGSGTHTYKIVVNSATNFYSYYTDGVLTSSFTGGSATSIQELFFGSLSSSNNGSTFDNLVFSNNAVPEPSTWALMLGGLGMLVAFQRKIRTRTNS